MADEMEQMKLQNQEMFKELLRLREGPPMSSERMITYDTVKHGTNYQTALTVNIAKNKERVI